MSFKRLKKKQHLLILLRKISENTRSVGILNSPESFRKMVGETWKNQCSMFKNRHGKPYIFISCYLKKISIDNTNQPTQKTPLNCATHTWVTRCVNRTLTMRFKTCSSLIVAGSFCIQGASSRFKLDFY